MASKKPKRRFDAIAKGALAKWPTWSNRLWPASRPGGNWLKAQPRDGTTTGPRLVAAGTDSFRTQPDGLWVFISAEDGFADCIAIEACSSRQNFSDKRSRYQPSTTATVLSCQKKWLCGTVAYANGERERWRFIHGMQVAPAQGLAMPIRFVRVLYFLDNDLYRKWRRSGLPAAHEFVASYASISSYTSPTMQEFLRRMSPEQHFYTD